MSQTQVILNHLRKHKTLTPIEALNRYRVMALSQRVTDLRKAGHQIFTEMVTRGDKRYARYHL